MGQTDIKVGQPFLYWVLVGLCGVILDHSWVIVGQTGVKVGQTGVIVSLSVVIFVPSVVKVGQTGHIVG